MTAVPARTRMWVICQEREYRSGRRQSWHLWVFLSAAVRCQGDRVKVEQPWGRVGAGCCGRAGSGRLETASSSVVSEQWERTRRKAGREEGRVRKRKGLGAGET